MVKKIKEKKLSQKKLKEKELRQKQLKKDILKEVHTVHGTCPECEEDTILVAIVTDYYRCTSCGYDTRQYVNGSIKYLRLKEDEIEWLKSQKTASQNY
jgi:transposase-like protein